MNIFMQTSEFNFSQIPSILIRLNLFMHYQMIDREQSPEKGISKELKGQNKRSKKQVGQLTELLKPFSFETSYLIEAILFEAEVIEYLQRVVPLEEYERLMQLLKSVEFSRVKENLRKQKVPGLNCQIMERSRDQLFKMMQSINGDKNDLVEAILRGDPLQNVLDTMEESLSVKQFKKLKVILNSKAMKQFRRGLKSYTSSNDRYQVEVQSLFDEFEVDTFQLVNAILQRKSEEEALQSLKLLMIGKEFAKLMNIMKSEEMGKIKSNIQRDYKISKLKPSISQRGADLLKKLKPFQLDFSYLVKSTLVDGQAMGALSQFRQIMSQNQYSKLTEVIEQQLLKSKQQLNGMLSEENYQSFEFKKREELQDLLSEFSNQQVNKLIDAIINQQPEKSKEIVQYLGFNLTGRQFKKLSALLGSEKMTEIMKSIHSKNLLENDGNDALFQTRYALESMFGEFDFDSKNLIEAILVADPMYESKILEQMSEKMNGKEYHKLNKILNSQEMQKFRKVIRSNLKSPDELKKCLLLQLKQLEVNSASLLSVINSDSLEPSFVEQKSEELLKNLHDLEEMIESKITQSLKEDCEETLEKADAFYQKGEECYNKDQDYPGAFKNFAQCLRIKEKLFGKGSADTITTLVWIGDMHFHQQNVQRAIYYYKLALKIYENKSFRDDVYAGVLYRLAQSYYKLQDYKKAVQYFEQSLHDFQQIDHEEWKSKSAKLLAKCLKRLSQFDRLQAVVNEYHLSPQDIQ